MNTNEEEIVFTDIKRLFVPITTVKAVVWILIIGLLVFFNSFFNAFIFDDNAAILQNLSVHVISSIPNIIQNNMISVYTSDYYRPIPFVLYTIFYYYFSTNAFFYHVIQVVLHISNAVLLFFLFKKYISRNLAFFLSVLFLVHPINESTAVYISNLPDVLFVFFGLIALLLLIPKKINWWHIVLSNIFLLFSITSKETGILFPAITSMYMYFFKKNMTIRYIVTSVVVGFIYLLLRLHAHVPLQKDPIEPIMALSFLQRMMQIPTIIFYYIHTFLFPLNLVLIHTEVIHSINFSDFFLPLLVDIFVGFGLLLMAWFLYKKTKDIKIIIFSLGWFFIGMLVHLQIIPLDITVSDRYFYFPMIGLLLFLGLYMNTFRFSRKVHVILVSIGVVLLLSLAIRTSVRNLDWKTQSILLAHDEKLSTNDYQQELVYGVDLIKQNRFQDAQIHVKRAIALYPQSWMAWDTLGALYIEMGDKKNAGIALDKSMAINRFYFSAYENMALLMWKTESAEKTRIFTTHATTLFPYSAKLWYYRFLSDYETKHKDDALFAAKEYYLLQQDEESYEIYYRLLHKLPINVVR